MSFMSQAEIEFDAQRQVVVLHRDHIPVNSMHHCSSFHDLDNAMHIARNIERQTDKPVRIEIAWLH